MHEDRLARHELGERRRKQGLHLRVAVRAGGGVLQRQVVHAHRDREDFRGAAVGLELHLRKGVLQLAVHRVAPGETGVELRQPLGKLLLRLDGGRGGLRRGVRREEPRAPDEDLGIGLFGDERLREVGAGERVERLERRGGLLRELLQLRGLLGGDDVRLDERLADRRRLRSDRIDRDGPAGAAEKQHVELLDDVRGAGRARGILRLRRGRLGLRARLRRRRGPVVDRHAVQSAQ